MLVAGTSLNLNDIYNSTFKVHVSDGQSDENSSHDPLVHNQTEIFMKENRCRMAAKACTTFFQASKKNQQSE
jgi:hypothetical protein